MLIPPLAELLLVIITFIVFLLFCLWVSFWVLSRTFYSKFKEFDLSNKRINNISINNKESKNDLFLSGCLIPSVMLLTFLILLFVNNEANFLHLSDNIVMQSIAVIIETVLIFFAALFLLDFIRHKNK